eukprot:TRINITY_DN10767_c0_g1_i1.p1 TRINITY_DN10767_c0_g1~~TRINITY_DN10767_c0_g1_i1.p1  ORF type:complete len:304 (-),score=60.13 TRINITY_DN10767_c0_g1_i1:85-996(-)
MSSEIRRRKQTVGTDDTDSEPLLKEQPSKRETNYKSNYTPNLYLASTAVTEDNAVSRYQFYALLLNYLRKFWDALSSFPISVPYLHNDIGTIPETTRIELQRFREIATKPFDSQNPEHEQRLTDLWYAAFPDRPVERISQQWKVLGFQGTNPATDFRGSGIFGLNCLIYLATKYPKAFSHMIHVNEESYPFAIAGLNVTMLLFELLGWGFKTPGKSTAKNPTTFAKIVPLILHSELDRTIIIFSELYCATFFSVDLLWFEMKASYFDFPKVIEKAQEWLETFLRTKGTEEDIFERNRAVESGF